MGALRPIIIMDKKFLAQIIGLLVLLILLIIPGIFCVGVMSHELYHYKVHSDYSQAVCVSINQDVHAFVIVNHTGVPDQFDYDLEELRANKFSMLVTSFYAFLVLCTLIWIILIVAENKKLKRRKK
ncbi:MAG: hypothetical protein U9Q69_01635 [Nanoarchaeota archaeon]|nr:hypothetical protein [Nanoarchaeota archaeon]